MRTSIPRTSLAYALGLLLMPWVLAGCDGLPGPAGGGGPAAGDENAEPDTASVYTHFTEDTELFLEFDALVAGETSVFAAHVTRLEDFTPLTEGTLDVVLERDGHPAARFRVREPAEPGIFTPGVAPRDPGRFDLVVEVAAENVRARHELGPVTVFDDPEEATAGHPAPEGDIAYLKEQQWNSPFATAPVQRRPLRPSVPGFATVRAPGDAGAEIRAPVDGYFGAGEWARAGEQVEADGVLGSLTPRLGEGADIGTLTVALARARADAELAEREVERLEGLYEQGAVPERRLLEARRRLEVARAERQAARARLEQYQRGDEQAGIVLRAPVAGEVVEVTARPGAFVRAGERLFRIAAPERRWLEVRVPERFAAELRGASGVWLDDPAGRTRVLDAGRSARVVQTGTAIDPVSRTASVTVEYPTAEGPETLGARFAAHVFTAEPESRLAVPRSAVIDDGGRAVVYVQLGGETFARRPVELGIVDGRYVEILRGVEAGERVVTEGAYYVALAAAGGDEIGHGHTH